MSCKLTGLIAMPANAINPVWLVAFGETSDYLILRFRNVIARDRVGRTVVAGRIEMKKFAGVLALLFLLCLVGCLEYMEQVKLNKDGSGSTQLRFAVSKDYFKQMDEMRRMMAQMTDGESESVEQPAIISSKEKIKMFFTEIRSGAKLESYKVSETDDFRVWNLSFTFTKLAELDHIGASVFQNEDEVEEEDQMGEDSLDMEHQPSVTFTKQDNGTWLFTRTMPNDDTSGEMEMDDGYPDNNYVGGQEYSDDYSEEEGGEESSMIGDSIEDALGAFTKEMEQMVGDPNKPAITFSVSFPGKVVESNASTVDGNTATWAFTFEQLSDSLPTMTASIEK